MTDTEQKRIQTICKVAHIDDINDLSDGYHTFRQLYYQRMVLFAALVKQNRDKAWKSLRHEDGELCFGGGWFIVGIDTPKGSYTYHYEDNYFSLFDCVELGRGKTWDGHTEKDVTRLLSLGQETCDDAISRNTAIVQSSHNKNGNDDCDMIIQKDIETIKALPPVTPQPKLGKYIANKSTLNAIPIPEGATNGDMIKAMFSPYKICEYEYSIHIYMTEEDFWKADYQMNYNTCWWNAPYKVESTVFTRIIHNSSPN